MRVAAGADAGDQPTTRPPLRLWPGLLLVLLQWLGWVVLPALTPAAILPGIAGAVAAAVGIVIWWAFFSRAPDTERWGAIVLMVLGLLAAPAFLHRSVATAGMGALFYFYAFPVLCLVFVLWAAVADRLPCRLRRVTMVAAIVAACGGWALVRTEGINAEGKSDFAWRWSASPEQRLLAARADDFRTPASASEATPPSADWPGFLGAGRDGTIRGVQIATDWSASPPVELWRRPVGPGWSSFAVAGHLLYTQEQRGDEELVSCYETTTGRPHQSQAEGRR